LKAQVKALLIALRIAQLKAQDIASCITQFKAPRKAQAKALLEA
jgi:hypothetical protein